MWRSLVLVGLVLQAKLNKYVNVINNNSVVGKVYCVSGSGFVPKLNY